MIINNLKNCIKEYTSFNKWSDEFTNERNKINKKFSFSIVVEGLCDELSVAVQWCLDNISRRNISVGEDYIFRKLKENSPDGLWTELWYGKTDYDYGFSEFFFKNQEDLSKFERQINNNFKNIL